MTTEAQYDPWGVFLYEVQMYWAMIKIREEIGENDWEISIKQTAPIIHLPRFKNRKSISPKVLPLVMNAFIESKLVHIRNLAEILTEKGTHSDDVGLSNLLPNWEKDKKLVRLIKELREKYGSNRDESSPCWTINKMIAHFTSHRTSSYNYQQLFETINPPLKANIKRVAKLGNNEEILELINSVL